MAERKNTGTHVGRALSNSKFELPQNIDQKPNCHGMPNIIAFETTAPRRPHISSHFYKATFKNESSFVIAKLGPAFQDALVFGG